MNSEWYLKAKAEKDEVDRRNLLQKQNLQHLKSSGMLAKIESVSNRVNQNTLYKVTFQEIGQRIEIIVDSEKVQDWKHVHVRVEAGYDKIELIYGAHPIPDDSLDARLRYDVVSSRPIEIKPEEVSEADIETWIGNVSEDRLLEDNLYNRESSYLVDRGPRSPILKQPGPQCKCQKRIFWILVLPMFIMALVAIVISFQTKGCN